jgi:serine/threonine-protein kinase
MALSPGTELGSYEVVSPLGAGGMGEVYRARDTRLGREVALKVLPTAFASDPERMARFQREAQVLASLNHPRIGAIYGFEDSNGVRALVMELIEGPTLADRIARGPISVDEALPLAREIAEALEAAHDRGIVHRDLKPANVKITPDGNVKVLDFGLAKAVEGDVSSTDIQNSPTLTRMSTQAGIILGTAAYMSPEQAKGKTVDRRTDIWAFG